MDIELLLTAIEVAATVAFALSGLIESTRRRMDIIGVFSVTFVSAFGGGTIRDVLLDRRPLFWVQHQEYVWLVVALTLTAPLLLRARWPTPAVWACSPFPVRRLRWSPACRASWRC